MKYYAVKEVFGPTLSGEGSRAGTVCLFLRFAGCNKWSGLEKDRASSSCPFCDTDFRGGSRMTAADIVSALLTLSSSVKAVVITGGEPTLQVDEPLLVALRASGFLLHLETNGSRPLGQLFDYFEHVTVSPKQSRLQTKLERAHDVKILYPSPANVSFEEFSDFLADHRFLQPVWDHNYAENLRATICRLYGNPLWRLSLQTHKIAGVQ